VRISLNYLNWGLNSVWWPNKPVHVHSTQLLQVVWIFNEGLEVSDQVRREMPVCNHCRVCTSTGHRLTDSDVQGFPLVVVNLAQKMAFRFRPQSRSSFLGPAGFSIDHPSGVGPRHPGMMMGSIERQLECHGADFPMVRLGQSTLVTREMLCCRSTRFRTRLAAPFGN